MPKKVGHKVNYYNWVNNMKDNIKSTTSYVNDFYNYNKKLQQLKKTQYRQSVKQSRKIITNPLQQQSKKTRTQQVYKDKIPD